MNRMQWSRWRDRTTDAMCLNICMRKTKLLDRKTKHHQFTEDDAGFCCSSSSSSSYLCLWWWWIEWMVGLPGKWHVATHSLTLSRCCHSIPRLELLGTQRNIPSADSLSSEIYSLHWHWKVDQKQKHHKLSEHSLDGSIKQSDWISFNQNNYILVRRIISSEEKCSSALSTDRTGNNII